MNEPIHQAAVKPAKFLCIVLFLMLMVVAITAYFLRDFYITIAATMVAAYTFSIFTEIIKRDITDAIAKEKRAQRQHAYSEDR